MFIYSRSTQNSCTVTIMSSRKTFSVDQPLLEQETHIRKKRKLYEYSQSELDSLRSPSSTEHHHTGNGDESYSDDSEISDKSSLHIEYQFPPLRRSASNTDSLCRIASTRGIQPTFASLGVSSLLQNALKGMSIKVPTEVQAACIPPLLEGKP